MRTLARATGISALAIIVASGVLAAHDMFLRPATHFAAERSNVLVRLLNGTFSKSENSITRDRLADVAIVSPSGRAALDTAQWSIAGDTSTFTLTTGAAGTYVLGTSTRPRIIGLPPKDFNQYLADDGMPDELAARKKDGTISQPSKERYHKHVKALVQVGTERSDAYATVMGYPAEIIPTVNPYTLKAGATLQVKTLVDGKPAGNQFVLYGGEVSGKGAMEQKSTRSNAEGIASIPLTTAGVYYIKFINMTKLPSGPVNYESKWATLTFEVR